MAFFGDHMGILGDAYRTYAKTGYLKTLDESAWSQEEYLSMHTTPFLVWNNFRKTASVREYGKVRAANFSGVVFDAAGLSPKDPVFHAGSKASECLPIPGSISKSSPECEAELSDWKNLQHFHLFDSE